MSAILFDMDGTLVDSEPLWFQAEKQVMAEVGTTWEQSDQINCLGGPMEKTERYMQERSGNIKPFGYFSERLNDVMDEKLKHELKLIPSALELLLDCKSAQIPMALVTASTGRQMRAVLERFPTGIFASTVSKDDVEHSKPDPAPYKLAANQLGVDIKSCLVLEDSITGVQSGLRAGAQVIGIPHMVQMQPHENLRVVKTLSDLSLKLLLDWYPHLDRHVSAK
jgi:HAD superfamily hydrolase (TIGR01509 family)